MRKLFHYGMALLLVLALLVGAGGCSGSSSETTGEKPTIVVGSKTFTEALLLGTMKAVFDAGVKEIARNGVDERDGFIWPSYVEDIMGPQLFDYGYGPFRWVCLSGKHEDLVKTDRAAMPVMQEVIAALEKEGLRDTVKVIIGGAPVTREYTEEIGADGYAPDAGAAVELCKQLVN